MGVQITTTVARVLRALLDAPDEPHYGMALMKVTGMASGSLYPILTRLEDAGWLASHREEIDPSAAGRPARRYYRLTGVGAREGRLALAELHELSRVAPTRSVLGQPAPRRG